ncbi:MAG: hypothetical protein ACKN9F_03560, partial [Methylomonas sp.]
PFCQPPAKASVRRMQAAVGWPFFWLLFFGHAKKSNSLVGARTDIQMASQSETFSNDKIQIRNQHINVLFNISQIRKTQ